jgi:hypothetical protein
MKRQICVRLTSITATTPRRENSLPFPGRPDSVVVRCWGRKCCYYSDILLLCTNRQHEQGKRTNTMCSLQREKMGYGNGMYESASKKMRKLTHRLRSDSVWDVICE